MGLLDGKIAIVTGGGQGIGRGIVRRYAKEGARVVIAELSATHGREAADEINQSYPGAAQFVQTDVADKAQVLRAVDETIRHFGALDVLVNNASALTLNVLLEQKTDEMLNHALGAGMWATWWFMQAALPHFKQRGGGRIINFYSIDADAAAWLHADYNMSKSAIQGLSRTAAAEWGRFNILTNVIAPAAAGTVYEKLIRDFPDFEQMAEGMNPLGRVGDPEADIAPVAVFLASEMARYVNGATIPVDGGQHLPRYASKPQNLAEMEKG